MKACILAAAIFLIPIGAAESGMVKSYDFDTGLSDTLGNGLDLIASGGTVSGGRYSFAQNQGLRLDSALLDTSNYGIEFKVQVTDSLSGWNKLIDFQNLASDIGLYFNGGSIQHYNLTNGAGTISLGTDFTIGYERAVDTVRIFLDGTLIHTFLDGNQAVSVPNILNFFEDDFDTSQGEAFAGSVDFIRIHEDASSFGTLPPQTVPEPASIAMWGVAALGLTCAQRKRRMHQLVA